MRADTANFEHGPPMRTETSRQNESTSGHDNLWGFSQLSGEEGEIVKAGRPPQRVVPEKYFEPYEQSPASVVDIHRPQEVALHTTLSFRLLHSMNTEFQSGG